MEAKPYIQAYRGKIVVIKYGGSAMTDEALRESFAGDVSLLNLVGIKPVIVHGGGPQITRAMRQAGVEPKWVDGLRVTDAESVRVVQTTLVGEINPDIVRLLSGHGTIAAGLNGLDGQLLVARPKDARLGFVGEVDEVNPAIIFGLLDRGIVPVIAPIGHGRDGAAYNINADTAAAAVAEAIGAEKLVYLTDVEGLYRDLGDRNSLLPRISPAGVRALIDSGAISAGMVPKLLSCLAALKGGVQRAHMLDGRLEHALLLEIFTPEGVGTMITAEDEP
ncbi:MAG: acetylglutamate kinase [Proteobacteria bacterium]|nr:acetylglutamate kinase [Pseudomonadota bacterium]